MARAEIGSPREQIVLPPQQYGEAVCAFAREINVPDPIAGLLIQRGIDTFEKARLFFRPSLDSLHDPFLMPGMRDAAQRIVRALGEQETIGLYGDYDVDGITSCALVELALTRLGGKVHTVIPNRLDEGYGLCSSAVREFAAAGSKLLITVDCGVTACDETAEAAGLGLDVIVTDHHEPGPVLPKALALLDPKLPGSTYPEKELAGVGVAFKLVQAVYRAAGLPETDALDYLDLVALGSAADVVPLLGENRLLVKFGLERMRATANVGLAELLRDTGLLAKEIRTHHILFTLAPMINAVGRLGDPRRAFRLLTSRNRAEALDLVAGLRSDNERRKQVDRQVTQEAFAKAQTEPDLDQTYAIVLASRNWHTGVVGIVASRLVERFHRPTVLIAIDENGIGKGSARSVSDFHIHDAISRCSSHLIKFGGHAHAAGLTIHEDSIEAFRCEFARVAETHLRDRPRAPVVKPCGRLRLSEIDPRFMLLLKMLEPYGPGNGRPVFYCDGLRLSGRPSIVGGDHLKFAAAQDGAVFEAIAFGMRDRHSGLDGRLFEFGAAFDIEENTWNGAQRTQLRIKGLDL